MKYLLKVIIFTGRKSPKASPDSKKESCLQDSPPAAVFPKPTHAVYFILSEIQKNFL